MTLQTPEDALTLPKGTLIMEYPLPVMGAAFSVENVLEAAQLIINHGDDTTFRSQAAVIAHAGNTYGWGVGGGYSAQSPAPVPAAVRASTVLSTAEDAFSLPEGRLALSCFEVSFGAENVAAAAQLIVENNDDTVFKTQAEVIAHAGNTYGWGTGGGYTAF